MTTSVLMVTWTFGSTDLSLGALQCSCESCDLYYDVRHGHVISYIMLRRYNGWYAGYQMAYNTSNTKLEANNVSGGYQGSDFTVHGSL